MSLARSVHFLLMLLVSVVLLERCHLTMQDSATSEKKVATWTMEGFVKADTINPILKPHDLGMLFTCPVTKKEIAWDQRNVLNPTALVKNDTVFLLFRAQDQTGTSRIGLAWSTDGLHFIKRSTPVFYPNLDTMRKYEWHFAKLTSDKQESGTYFDGTEDPRIVQSEDGTYIMTYTAYDGKIARLCLASSSDLLHWNKHGLVLKESVYKNLWSKSGSIVCRQVGNKSVATKINGKYWMYFGDTDLFMAVSDNLLEWTPDLNDESKKMIRVLHPRPGYFDSRLVEPGPQAMITSEGILLIYNGSNAANCNDSSLPTFTYAAGQVLFDKDYPYKQIARMNTYFLHPNKDYEKTGEVNEVCFVEGLVYFKNSWFLYYGTADSKIAVAIKNSPKSTYK